MSNRDEYEHARQNAKGWYETIRDAYREFDDRKGVDVPEPLSAEVRSPWYNPYNTTPTPPPPTEYMILLTTGGPALRVWGELDRHGEPENARLEMQDWGIPWREVWPCEVEEMDEAREALLWYAQQFISG